MQPISSSPSPTLRSASLVEPSPPVRPAAPASRSSDRVTLSDSDLSGLYGLHTLQAYPENGGPQLERSQQLASGGQWMTEAASLKSISDRNDPVSRQRREALLDTISWAHQNGLKMNVRLDYDWGQNVPQDEAGRREYAAMMRDFIKDAQARTGGDDTVANWVVGNEPNLAHENGGRVLPPQDYVAAVRSVRQALDADPATRSANLASAGLSPGGSDPQQYFRGMLQAGLGDQVGTYGVHEYADRLDNLDAYDRMAQQAGAAHPLAVTEFGIPRQGGLNASQQAAQTSDFVRQVAARNQQPGKSPVQNVTLWKANRGPGEEAYSLTPEMLQSLSGLGHERVDTAPLRDNFGGLFNAPASGNGSSGNASSGGGGAPLGGSAPTSGNSLAKPPDSPDRQLQQQSRQVLANLDAPSGDRSGAQQQAQRLQSDYAGALQDRQPLRNETHQQVGQALQATGLENPAGQGGSGSGASSGGSDPSGGGASSGGAGPSGSGAPSGGAGPSGSGASSGGAGPSGSGASSGGTPPVAGGGTGADPRLAGWVPDSRGGREGGLPPFAVLSPDRPVAGNAPLPPPDPSKPMAVSYILENRDPRLPDNPPGVEGYIKDKDGQPIDATGLTVRFDGGAEPFYIPIVNKPERGPGFYEVPLVVPPGFKGRYNLAVGRRTADGGFEALSNTANVEVTRDHRRTQVDFQSQAGT